MRDSSIDTTPLRRRRRWFIWMLAVYFVVGTISQKVLPAGEIFPFFGWSLFSRVDGPTTAYRLLIHEFRESAVDPPVTLLDAPPTMVGGDRSIARKVIQRLGRAQAEGDSRRVERLRRLIEQSYLQGSARYELVAERYQPLTRWRTGEPEEVVRLGSFATRPARGKRKGARADP